MKAHLLLLAIATIGMLGCSSEPASAPVETPAPTTESPDHEEDVTELPPLKIGDYEVHANYEGPLADGHFNFHVTGPEFAAIRQWVGPEDAEGVVVGRAQVLSDHIHAVV